LGIIPATADQLAGDAAAVISGAWWGVLPSMLVTISSIATPTLGDLPLTDDLLQQVLAPCLPALLISALVLPVRWQCAHE